LYPLNRRLVGLWNQPGRHEGKKNLALMSVYVRGKKNGEGFSSDGNISE
jgi:hypothetical protein